MTEGGGVCVTEGGGCRGDQDFFKGKILFYSQWKRMCNIESPHSYLEPLLIYCRTGGMFMWVFTYWEWVGVVDVLP